MYDVLPSPSFIILTNEGHRLTQSIEKTIFFFVKPKKKLFTSLAIVKT